MGNGKRLQPKKKLEGVIFYRKKRKEHPTHLSLLCFVGITMDFVLSVSLEINQVVLSTFQRLPRHVGANRKVSHQNCGTGIFSDSKEIFGFRL